MYIPAALMASKAIKKNYARRFLADYVSHLAGNPIETLDLVKPSLLIQTPELFRPA